MAHIYPSVTAPFGCKNSTRNDIKISSDSRVHSKQNTTKMETYTDHTETVKALKFLGR